MHFEGRPRSIAEMEFIARMFPCEICGERRPLELETGGSGDVWVVTGTCARCRNELRFVFETDEDLFAVDQPDLELGDDEPSRIIGPYDLMQEIDRLVPAIVLEPSRLDEPACSAPVARVDPRRRLALGGAPARSRPRRGARTSPARGMP